jgi:Putative restriction endonuclease
MTTVTVDLETTVSRPSSYEEERDKPTPSFNHSWVQDNLIAQFSKHLAYRGDSELTLEIDGQRHTSDLSIHPGTRPVDLRHDVIRQTTPPLLVVEILLPQQGSHKGV